MAKVSKNIKKVRKEKNLTQDFVAQKLNVTRQAISNWENDKSQPDIESLKLLAEVMEVEIEELIYGEKRQVGIEPDKSREKNKVRIILSIVGSLFIGVGLVLLFSNFWSDLPRQLKAVFSVLPILISQAFVIFVFLKKKSSVLWRESAAIIWTVGVISTVALINSVFNIHCGYENCLLIDVLLCLPIIFLLDAVSPLAVYFYMVIHWGILSEAAIIPVILFVIGVLYVYLNRNDSDDIRHKYSLWVSSFAALILVAITSMRFDIKAYAPLLAFFICTYALSKKDSDYSLPYKPIGVLGIALTMMTISFSALEKLNSSFLARYSWSDHNDYVIYITLAISIIAIALCVYLSRESFIQNIPKIVVLSCSSAAMLFTFFTMLYRNSLLGFGVMAFTIATGAMLIIKGVLEIKLLITNLGLVIIFAEIMQLLVLIDINALIMGIAFLVFGIAIIFVNSRMSSRKKEVQNATPIDKEAEI